MPDDGFFPFRINDVVLGLFGSAAVWVAPPEAWLTGGSC